MMPTAAISPAALLAGREPLPAWQAGAAPSRSFLDLLRATADQQPEDPSESALGALAAESPDDAELKTQFTNFVGQTLYGQLFKSMRDTLGKPAYFHGGRTEEIFQQQLDQVLTERMTKAHGGRLAESMYNLQFAGRNSPGFSAEA